MTTKEHPIKAARRAGVPLVAIETADPAMAIMAVVKALNGKADSLPVLQWDCVNGITGINERGRVIADELSPNGAMDTANPTEAFTKLRSLPEGSVCFLHNGHRYLEQIPNVQALWLLRDTLKARRCTVILLAPAISLPVELKHDVVVLTEDLPGQDEITRIVESICKDAGQPAPEDIGKVSDALLGLSAFAAEQCFAMSLTKEGLDRAGLWERKRKTIEQTKGLSVWRGGESFGQIGGCDNVKGFMRDILNGRRAPRAICFIDEIEKVLSGTGDTSGVSQDYLGQLLTFMQDKSAAGCIFIGPPGAAKSAVAKAAGNEANIPTIALDLGGMKGSLVGQSEQQLRTALQVVDAVSQGQTLFIATCNSFGNLPPELKRRFTLGTFFFDLPTDEERQAIWAIYMEKYQLPNSETVPPDQGWTGAEIKQCCDIAWRLKRSLAESAKFIVPVAKSAADTIETLRKQASGKFISASYSGLYKYTPPPVATGRKLGD